MYMPYPLQIVQSHTKVNMVFEFANAERTIHLNKMDPYPNVGFMGYSLGRWEGDTLVVDVTQFTDATWFDRSGNFHSDALKVTERWRRVSANQLSYEETIDDPKFYTKPWTVSWLIPIAPKEWELMEYACTDNNKDMSDGHLQPGPLDGSLRDGTAIAPPPRPRRLPSQQP